MTRTRPTGVVRAVAALSDVVLAGVSCAGGGVVGYWAMLGLLSLGAGRLPRLDELVPVPFLPLFGAAIGLIVGVGIRASVGGIRLPGLWILGFFVAGAIVVPVAFLALVAYAVSGRPY